MGRRFLMVLLGVGAALGFASGFAHLCGFRHYGSGGHFDRHAAFERHVADTCADSALKVYQRQSGSGSKP